ncbi:9-O-acetylesterase [Haloferula helveola]|uniref:9-O-acetylesterase n=1 Tax=Haloferula helveola TaxID=490095 RepID=A0ABN6H4M6_9BACT|nr:9-O-acetylesterase [Haloferula helveola]
MKLGKVTLCVLAALVAPAIAQPMPKEDVVEVPAIGDGLFLHNLFQSNMVLQRDKPFSIWGWAAPGEKVTVTLAGQSQESAAADDRSWKVTFPAMPASADPVKMSVKGASKTLELENILFGDVWVLGGQSNMEFEVGKVQNGNLEMVSAHYPQIRILTIPAVGTPEKQKGFERLHQWSSWSSRHFRKGDWDVCSPEIVKELSAIGYVFARRVHMASQIPIGVIDVSRGGTTVEAWTPDPVLRKMDSEPVKTMLAEWDEKVAAFDPQEDLASRVAKHQQWVEKMKSEGKEIPANRTEPTDLKPGPAMDHNRPGSCYAGMIGPLEGLAAKGAIFHQGFNNCFSGTEGARMYRDVFPEMIKAWRAAFGDPEMPFGILSLCTAGDKQDLTNFSELMLDAGPFIREAQHQTYAEMVEAGDENIGFTSTYDLRRRWYHPQLKFPAGERIARWALATEYGFDRELRWKPPVIEEMKVEDGRIVLNFDQSVGGVDDGGGIEGFAIAGEDRRFHPATADSLVIGKDDRGRDRKDNKAIVLTSPLVSKPVHFRYAWARNPMGNVQPTGNTDIPLPTQRSDDWAMEEAPLGVLDEKAGENPRADRGKLQKALREQDLQRQIRNAEALIEENSEN